MCAYSESPNTGPLTPLSFSFPSLLPAHFLRAHECMHKDKVAVLIARSTNAKGRKEGRKKWNYAVCVHTPLCQSVTLQMPQGKERREPGQKIIIFAVLTAKAKGSE